MLFIILQLPALSVLIAEWKLASQISPQWLLRTAKEADKRIPSETKWIIVSVKLNLYYPAPCWLLFMAQRAGSGHSAALADISASLFIYRSQRISAACAMHFIEAIYVCVSKENARSAASTASTFLRSLFALESASSLSFSLFLRRFFFNSLGAGALFFLRDKSINNNREYKFWNLIWPNL